jgi:hypothetical protein
LNVIVPAFGATPTSATPVPASAGREEAGQIASVQSALLTMVQALVAGNSLNEAEREE